MSRNYHNWTHCVSRAVRCVASVSGHRDRLQCSAECSNPKVKPDSTLGGCTTGGPTEEEWEMAVASDCGVNSVVPSQPPSSMVAATL